MRRGADPRCIRLAGSVPNTSQVVPAPNIKKRNTLPSQPKIYIEEVLEVAAKYECYYQRFSWYLLTKMQVPYTRVARALPFRRSDDVYQEYRRKVAHTCSASHQGCVRTRSRSSPISFLETFSTHRTTSPPTPRKLT